ncbi:MAG: hypothetical protein ABH884_01570 [Candidatus Komeilibacteria bacterium]
MRVNHGFVIRIILLVSLAVVVWIVGVMVGQENTVTILNPEASITGRQSFSNPQVSIMLDFNNGQIDVYDQLFIINDKDLWTALKNLAVREDLQLDYNKDWAINGLDWYRLQNKLTSESGVTWHVWVNNQYRDEDLTDIILKNGDVINFKYLYYQL